MERLTKRNRSARPVLRGLAWLVGGLTSLAALAVGVALAVVFAATFLVVGLMAAALLGLSLAAFKARRTVEAPIDGDVIEARNVGGHSWIAYGWDGARH
jgi:hypothetical protein